MRLIRATIDGFGKWNNTTFDFSKNSLYCFYGENESGKTTLQQFIIYMLFGLPPKKRKLFIPKNQSSIAGTLFIYDNEIGDMRIRRVDGSFSCILENGEERDETWWKTQLRSISKELYLAVNAFSATDLEAIRSMDHASLSDILFSIGLSGSTTIYDVEKQLRETLDKLYKKRGKNPVINKQMEKVSVTYDTLERYRENEATYAPLVEEKENTETIIQTKEATAKKLKKDLIVIENTLRFLPQIQKYQQHCVQLLQYPNDMTFPREGLSRYQHLKEKLLPKKSEYDLLQEKQISYNEQLQSLQQDQLDDAWIQQAEMILQGENDFNYRIKTIDKLQASLEQATAQKNDIMQQLEWERDETEDAVLPFHLEDTWHQFAGDKTTIDKERHNIEEERHVLEEKRFRLLREKKDVHQAVLPENDRKRVETQLTNRQIGKEGQAQKKQYQAWKDRQQSRWKKMIPVYAMFIVLSVIGGVVFDQLLFYGVAAFLIVGAIAQYMYIGVHAKTMENMLFTGKEMESLTQEEKHQLEKQLEASLALEYQLSEIDATLRHNNLSQIQIEEQQQMVGKRAEQLDSRIDGEQFAYPFLKGLEVIHWPTLLQRIRELQKVNQTITDLEQDIASNQAANATILKQIENFPYAQNFHQVRALMENNKKTTAGIQQYEIELEKTHQAIQEVTTHMETIQREINALFQVAQAKDEESFYKVAEDVTTRDRLKEETTSILNQLYDIFSSEKAEALIQDNFDRIQLESKQTHLQDTLSQIESEITDTYHQLGEMQAKITQMEGAEDISQLSLTYEIEKNALQERAAQWMVQKLAQTALEKAKKSYQEKHFAKVMDKTGTYFSQLTDGHYDTIIPPRKNGLFQVEGKENIRYTVEELSQGTIDQLYVSLRFAIANVMQDEFNLPLLIDDAFVHFDQNRTTQTIRLMETLSKQQQVICFTCKADVADQFEDVFILEGDQKITS